LVEGDSGQLQQIVMNLIINAAEAVPPERQGTVLVTTAVQESAPYEEWGQRRDESSQAAGGVVVSIKDNGVGMSADLISRIFDPFFTTKFTGRGLGLAAVQGMVRAHKGNLRVHSVPGQGSTFQFFIPAGPAGPAQQPKNQEPIDLRGAGTILVIDDEDVVRKTAKAALERFGYRVLLARDGQEGIEMFRDNRDEIALVLLDMTMPVLDGEQTFRLLRSLQRDVRVIVSSGYSASEAAKRFPTDGTVAFIQKPYVAAKLAETVKRFPAAE
jgi:CheY-like chemotaxis protein